jgi:voltage-gated potassium channel
MSVFRLARLARLVTATGFGRNAYRLFRRLGTLGIWVTAASVLAALMVLHAEPPSSGFSNFGDALWWALVSFTTVGYGDLYPVTPIGRIAGILMMFAGLARWGPWLPSWEPPSPHRTKVTPTRLRHRFSAS